MEKTGERIGLLKMNPNETIQIGSIPSLVWGGSSGREVIAVHGNLSDKADAPIALTAGVAVKRGYQVLSFDLPGHGERKEDGVPCTIRTCTAELGAVMEYAKKRWKRLDIFANSLGTYFSLLAYKDEPLEAAWFLSPVVDMGRIIKNMMTGFHITKERLEEEGMIHTPIGQDMYWDDYCYEKEHPISKWDVQTDILYGSEDTLCGRDAAFHFAEKFSCSLQITQGAEHYFHTPAQLRKFEKWLQQTLR